MVATKPVDFHKNHDGLAALVKNELYEIFFTGTLFVFRSKRAAAIILGWHGLVMPDTVNDGT